MTYVRHFSETEITEIVSVPQIERTEGGRGFTTQKPNGLWLAIGEGWVEYCASLERPLGTYAYDVTLRTSARLALLITLDDLKSFSQRFGFVPEIFQQNNIGFVHIDWLKVAAEYDGICLMQTFPMIDLDETTEWIHSWDCASACIWNKAAICEFKRVLP